MTDLETIRNTLDAIADPLGRGGLVTSGRVAPPKFEDGKLRLVLDVSGLSPAQRDALDQRINEQLKALPGVTDVRIAMTSERTGRQIIAVASGKGGVGKSTVSVNLAIALARSGIKVGLVDADIYGPSQPRLTGSEGQKPQAEGQKLIPIETTFGIPLLSMGHLVKPGQAIAWRGPMAGNALSQLIEADWGGAELLIVDMPPGTGDVQLSMIQKHKPAGVVIVSTPQDLALIDAAFGMGGAESAAADMGMAFLGRIPLTSAIRIASDAGQPPAAGGGPEADAFMAIARQLTTWFQNTK
jgi:ATP-binding protein involved in chromosome partitioning